VLGSVFLSLLIALYLLSLTICVVAHYLSAAINLIRMVVLCLRGTDGDLSNIKGCSCHDHISVLVSGRTSELLYMSSGMVTDKQKYGGQNSKVTDFQVLYPMVYMPFIFSGTVNLIDFTPVMRLCYMAHVTLRKCY